ncbi:hypothetical protein DVH24_036263 [Malus domestica]|uniref:Uncharacterized protein n=1 Tax=Malus domestica TaxID=3750 RepID=A0A498IIN9_MALDO|nr:hypothetical protein DVH24_036263 [Malus domestica]
MLVLFYSTFEAFPSSIVSLKHIRYLELSGNERITELPDAVCKFPRDISKLISLRWLEITTKQTSFPDNGLDLANGNYQQIPMRLRSLIIARVPRMAALPVWLQGAANTLRVLCIWGCENLDALPEWLTRFTSLRILDLKRVSKIGFSTRRDESSRS